MPVALRSATFAVAAVALLGTAATGHAQEPIRIGVLQPMTGPATKNGTENYTAMQIARDMINERGGVNGRKVDFLLADIPTPTAAISETERLTTKDAGGPVHRVESTAFEVTRIRLGRRSPEQVAAMAWEPALPAVPDGLFIFGPRTTPLEE